jgi:hypothetical protein
LCLLFIQPLRKIHPLAFLIFHFRLLKLERSNNIKLQTDFGTSQSSGSSLAKSRKYRMISGRSSQELVPLEIIEHNSYRQHSKFAIRAVSFAASPR